MYTRPLICEISCFLHDAALYISIMCVSILSIYHSIYIYIYKLLPYNSNIIYIYMCELCRIDYVIHVEISFPINVSMCEWKV